MKRRIKAFFDGSLGFGTIEILSKTAKTAYAIWSIYDVESKLIASFTNNYFIGKENSSDEEIFTLVKEQILKYRIGRKKVFFNIEFEEN